MIIFTSLCDEMDFLCETAQRKYYPTLAVFGTFFDNTVSPGNDSAEMRIARMLPWLQSLDNYIERCCEVVGNTREFILPSEFVYKSIDVMIVVSLFAL